MQWKSWCLHCLPCHYGRFPQDSLAVNQVVKHVFDLPDSPHLKILKKT
jgi:hypothetical protein